MEVVAHLTASDQQPLIFPLQQPERLLPVRRCAARNKFFQQTRLRIFRQRHRSARDRSRSVAGERVRIGSSCAYTRAYVNPPQWDPPQWPLSATLAERNEKRGPPAPPPMRRFVVLRPSVSSPFASESSAYHLRAFPDNALIDESHRA